MNAEPNRRDWITLDSAPLLNKSLSAHIIDAVCDWSDVRRDDLFRHSRLTQYIIPRQMTMYLLYHLTTRSYPSIGFFMGRDHTTIMHGVRKIEGLVEHDKPLASAVVALESRVIDLHTR